MQSTAEVLSFDLAAPALQFCTQKHGLTPRTMVPAGLDGASADRAGASGAWLLLAEVSAQDPSAVSWQFLQVSSQSGTVTGSYMAN